MKVLPLEIEFGYTFLVEFLQCRLMIEGKARMQRKERGSIMPYDTDVSIVSIMSCKRSKRMSK